MLAHRIAFLALLWVGTLFFLSGCHKHSVIAPSQPSPLNNGAYSSRDYKDDLTAFKANLDGVNDPGTAKQIAGQDRLWAHG